MEAADLNRLRRGRVKRVPLAVVPRRVLAGLRDNPMIRWAMAPRHLPYNTTAGDTVLISPNVLVPWTDTKPRPDDLVLRVLSEDTDPQTGHPTIFYVIAEGQKR